MLVDQSDGCPKVGFCCKLVHKVHNVVTVLHRLPIFTQRVAYYNAFDVLAMNCVPNLAQDFFNVALNAGGG